MPLSAIVDGQDIVAPFLDDGEWEVLKSAVSRKEKSVIMPCCDAAGRLRVSKLGTKHFYHAKTADCNWKPETQEHLRAKAEILIACRAAGYSATSEKSGSDWRADVYAEKGKSKIAFEVQWSRQTLEETQERQARYERDGVKCCWFFRKPPFDSWEWKTSNKLPIFKLSNGQTLDEPFLINAPSLYSPGKEAIPLQVFVTSLLERKIRYRTLMTSHHTQRIQVNYVLETCWKCHKTCCIFYVKEPFKSQCSEQMRDEQLLKLSGEADNGYYEFLPEVISAVRQHLETNRTDRRLKVGAIKTRYSNPEQRAYKSFGCFYCDALFGDFFLYGFNGIISNARMYDGSYASLETDILLTQPISQNQPHWCYPSDGNFCNVG